MAENDKRDIIARTRAMVPSPTASEATAAHTMIAHADEIVSTSIEAWARRASVSMTTVLRYCQSLGFKSIEDHGLRLVDEGRVRLVVGAEARLEVSGRDPVAYTLPLRQPGHHPWLRRSADGVPVPRTRSDEPS